MKQYRDRAMYQTHDGAWMRFTYLESEVLMVIGVVFVACFENMPWVQSLQKIMDDEWTMETASIFGCWQ